MWCRVAMSAADRHDQSLRADPDRQAFKMGSGRSAEGAAAYRCALWQSAGDAMAEEAEVRTLELTLLKQHLEVSVQLLPSLFNEVRGGIVDEQALRWQLQPVCRHLQRSQAAESCDALGAKGQFNTMQPGASIIW